MSQPIVYVDTSKIRKGRLEELQFAMKHLTTFVEANVPQIISYGFCLNESRTRVAVVAVHPNSASLQFHLDASGEERWALADLIELVGIDVYGTVSDAVLMRLHRRARMLGRGTVAVHGAYAGFAR